MDDCLEIVGVLRANGLEPTLVDIGMGRADFRLGIKYKDPYDVFYAGKAFAKKAPQGGADGKLAGNNGSVAQNKTSPVAK